jgi:hypothetical protein
VFALFIKSEPPNGHSSLSLFSSSLGWKDALRHHMSRPPGMTDEEAVDDLIAAAVAAAVGGSPAAEAFEMAGEATIPVRQDARLLALAATALARPPVNQEGEDRHSHPIGCSGWRRRFSDPGGAWAVCRKERGG